MKELSPVMLRYLTKLQKREISIMEIPVGTFCALLDRGLIEHYPEDKEPPKRARLSEAGRAYRVET